CARPSRHSGGRGWSSPPAYTQLRLAHRMSPDLCRPWEKRARPGRGSSPHRVRRGFRHLQEQVGTPARVPKRSGPGPGRPRGGKNRPAPRYPVWTKRIKQTPCWSAGREEELNLKFRRSEEHTSELQSRFDL